MNVTPIILAIRALSAEFAKRMYIPVVWLTGGVLILGIGVLSWLVTMSGWWWVGLAPLIVFTVLFAITSVVTWVLISLLAPHQNHEQKQKVSKFVDALEQSSETIQTPKFILLFRLVRDMMKSNEHGFVRELSSHATTLRTGFQEIVASFKK